MNQKRTTFRALFACATLVLSLALGAAAVGAGSGPYFRLPKEGDSVRFDGSIGGQRSAWAYHDEQWLQTYLQIIFDAADRKQDYADTEKRLNQPAEHVTTLNNGTRGTVEEIRPYRYKNHDDVEVRVLVEDTYLRGNELWTTCAELVDKDGHPYIKF